MTARTPESLRAQLHGAMIGVLSNLTGGFTSCDDGYFIAPDVPGLRVRLEYEGEERPASVPAPRRASQTKAAQSAPATRAQRGLFDEDEE